jgi:GDP-L-fucose synthase
MLNRSDRILVTGASGLIGSNLVNRLRNEGHEVICCTSTTDLRDTSVTSRFFADVNPSIVFHLAAKVGGIHANSSYKSEFYYDNIMINTNVVKSSVDVGVDYFFAMGTGCAYPKRLEQSILSESDYLDGIPEPTNDAYAYAKRCLLVHLQSLPFNTMNYTFCIPANIYGPFDNFDPLNSHVVPGLINRFFEAKTFDYEAVNVWGDGTARRDFLFIDDCIDAMILLANGNHFGSFNVSSGKLTSIKDLAFCIAAVTGYQGHISFDPSKLAGQSQRIFDNTKMNALGWSHQIDLDSGIRTTVDWLSSNSSSARRR